MNSPVDLVLVLMAGSWLYLVLLRLIRAFTHSPRVEGPVLRLTQAAVFFGGLALFLGGSTLGNHDTVPDPVLLAIRAVGVLGAAGLALGGTGLGVLAIIGRDAKPGSAVVVA